MPQHPATTAPATAALRAGVALEQRCLALHRALAGRRAELRAEGGQGTVEYVALILLVGAILSAVVAANGKANFNIGSIIGNKLADVIKTVGTGK